MLGYYVQSQSQESDKKKKLQRLQAEGHVLLQTWLWPVHSQRES
jgi:hypothetical protein